MPKIFQAILFISLLFVSSKVITGPEILIKYKDDNTQQAIANSVNQNRLSGLNTLSNKSFSIHNQSSNHVYAFKTTDTLSITELNSLLINLNTQSNIEYAELNGKLYPDLVPNDTSYINQWTLNNAIGGINIERAWDTTTGNNVVVAVLDTGSLAHSDINGRYVVGYDFVSNTGTDLNGNLIDNDGTPGRDADPTDPGDGVGLGDCAFSTLPSPSSWHGLSVSSIIAANSNNASNIAGINWSASIMPIRVLARCGGDYDDTADAIRWAAGIADINLPTPPITPAKIINLSLGGPTGSCPATLQSAIDDAYNAGSLIVVSAGNDSSDASGYSLSNCNNVISVAASTIDGNLTSYSNFGSTIDITAPAGGGTTSSSATLVLGNTGSVSADSETIYSVSGTSFSAPHVSGVASLMYAVRPDISTTRAANILRLTARAFPSGSNCTSSTCGNGILDAATAVRFAQSDDLFGNSLDTISFVEDTACVVEDAGNVALQLQRIGSGIGNISIHYQTIDGSAQGNSDYDITTGRIMTWENGDTANKTIEIPVFDDVLTEAAETFSVTISDISDSGNIGNNQTNTITIQSDDNTTALCSNVLHQGGQFRLINLSQNINETAGTVTINVARESGNSGTVTLDYNTIPGTADAGDDFTATSGTLTWADGDNSNKAITINITDDGNIESNENFSVELHNNSNNTTINGSHISVIVIESNEQLSGSGAQSLLTLLLLLALALRNRYRKMF